MNLLMHTLVHRPGAGTAQSLFGVSILRQIVAKSRERRLSGYRFGEAAG